MIYFDNSATTKPDPTVLKSFEQVSNKFFANPSSIHTLGGQVEKLLKSAREQTAQLLQVKEHEVIFTSGGTEGNNIAIKGAALAHQNRGKHIITTTVEHPSVYDACKHLEELGFKVTYIPVNKAGVVSVKDVKAAIQDDTILISVMHVNNEIGSIQPIKEIGKVVKNHPKILFHVDDVQGLGKIPFSIEEAEIDLCTYSGHKIHGLNGSGILYVKEGTHLFPLFHGGGQEFGYRSGTENVAGAVSFARALRLVKEKEDQKINKLVKMQQYARDKLNEIGVHINTPEKCAPHIINISIPSFKPETIIHMLAEKEIYISTKSACSSKKSEESRVLSACGYDKAHAASALRISFSYQNEIEEIDIFCQHLDEAIKHLKKTLE